MTHLWVRAEQRPNEDRVGLTPEGAARLIAAGIELTVEHSGNRCIPIDRYAQAGASIAPENSWPAAPDDAIIFGLKELPFSLKPNIHFFILCHKVVMVGFVKEGYQVQADISRSRLMAQKPLLAPSYLRHCLYCISRHCGECRRGRELLCGGALDST